MKNGFERLAGELREKGADIVKFLDISEFPEDMTRGFGRAVLLCMALSKSVVADIIRGETDGRAQYLEKEEAVEALADWLAERLRLLGYHAFSQSTRNNLEAGSTEWITPQIQEGISTLPQKALARQAGMGFIGKNNLLASNTYGCALVICSVLTDAPLTTENHPPIPSQCGDCRECVEACPTGALRGSRWSPEAGRDAMVDVSKCTCALTCLIRCPWTRTYAGI